jgi:PAS domain S-box-containing protein
MHSLWRRYSKIGWLFLLLLLFGAMLSASVMAEPTPIKKVLLLYSYGSDVPVQGLFTKGLQEQLRQNPAVKVDFSFEYLDMAKYPSKQYGEIAARFLKEKYALNRPDLIITHFDPAAIFMTDFGEQTFPGVPAVFGLYEGEGETYIDPPANYRNVVGIYGMKSAVSLILQAQPATKKIYVIVGDSERERKTVDTFKNMAGSFADRVEFVYLNKLPFTEMEKVIKDIHGDAAILYIFLFRDAAGNNFIPGDALNNLYQVAKVPIYSSVSIFLGRGTMGGYMASQEVLGARVADVAADLLQRNIAAHAPTEKVVAAEYIFDWRELIRWGISEDRLPANSRIEFRQPTIWETHRWQIVGGIMLILLQGLLIAQLLISRQRRRKAEAKTFELNRELSESLSGQQELNASLEEEITERQAAQQATGDSEARYRAVLDQAPEAVSICDPNTGEILETNARFTRLFGYDLQQDRPLFLYDLAVDTRSNIDALLEKLKNDGSLPLQRRVLRHKNGTLVDIERAATLVRFKDRNLLVQTLRNVTEEVRRERKRQENSQLAAKVQKTLLPALEPSEYLEVFTIYNPLDFVGGDLYFLSWRYHGNMLRGYLIDATGHGFGTALHTASLHVLLREVNEADIPLSSAMNWLNRRASEYFAEGVFAGALGFEIDLQTRQLRWVCAGIPKVWVSTHAHQGVLSHPGLLLGIVQDETFDVHSLPIEIGDSLYFMTDGLTDLLDEPATLPLDRYPEMVKRLQVLSETKNRRDDATAVCIHVRALPQSLIRQDGWPRIIRFNGYGDYQRLKGEIAKVLAEVTGQPHSLQEVAVHEALANAMECRDGVPRQHKARLRFNKVGARLIVRVKTSRLGFAGNAILRRLRSQPEDMFSFGEDASMGRGIPMMLSMSHKMTYNSEGTELLLAWRL